LDIRAAAARAMGRIQSWDYLSDLTRLLKDPEPAVVGEALFALGQLAYADPPSADSVVQTLKNLQPLDHDPRAVEAMGKLGAFKPDLVQDVLIRQTKNTNPAVREQAVIALFRLFAAAKERPQSVAFALIDAAADAEDSVRWRAVYALSKPREPRAIPALMQKAKDPALWVRLFAVRALGKTEDPGVSGTLGDAAHDPEPLVRFEAIQALTQVKQPRQIPVELLQDASFHVRAAAARALGNAGLFDAAHFKTLIEDPSPVVRGAAIAAYGASFKGRRLPEEIRSLAADRDWRIRAHVAQTAGPEDLDLVRQARSDSDERVQAAALHAIGKIDTDDAWALVIESLGSDKLSVRAAAVEIAAERKKPQVASALMDAYRHSMNREWIEVREMIVDALGRQPKTPDIGAFLQQVLGSDPAPSVRTKASQALGLARSVPASKIDRPDLLSRTPAPGTHVVLETEKGEIEIELFVQDAPVHAANFVELVEKGHYNGLLFHRVVSNFVIQGGDPRGDGFGDAGYSIRDEINPIPFERGTVGMPKAGKDTGGCQFFITHVPTPHLDGRYTVFGKVIRGLDVVDKIEVGDRITRASTVAR
jgi:cyclophilin family peptidyl-prolyl cis-trans isomerase/HEAT repeat protein